MKNWLIFSDTIHSLKKQLFFYSVVFIRFFRLLLSSNKEIEVIHFNYPMNYKFKNGNFIIDFHFKNVLWYEIKNLYKTTNHQSLSINPNIINFPIELIVYGFFRKKIFKVSLENKQEFNFDDFKVKLGKVECKLEMISRISVNLFKIISRNKFKIIVKKRELFQEKIEISTHKIKIQFTNFNQNDFI
jgi:hypothetical protein